MTREQLLAKFPKASESFIASNLGAGKPTPQFKVLHHPELIVNVSESFEKPFPKENVKREVKVFTAKMTAIGAPRMTRADAWKKRPAVLRYFVARTNLRDFVPAQECPDELHWQAWIPMPDSWSKTKKNKMDNKPHRQKPDRDNIDKFICDAVFHEDKGIWSGSQSKFWCREGAQRIQLTLVYWRKQK